MKRKAAFILLLAVLGAIGYLGFSIYSEFRHKQAIRERISEWPEFTLSNLQGERVQSRALAGQSPVILTYFSTTCEFCRAEIRSIRQHPTLQQESSVYLVSDEPRKILQQFAGEFKLDSVETIQVLWDSTRQVNKLYGITGVPSTFVYDSDGQLLESFKGETKAEVLFDLIR